MATVILDLSVTFRKLFYNFNEESPKTPREVVKFFSRLLPLQLEFLSILYQWNHISR